MQSIETFICYIQRLFKATLKTHEIVIVKCHASALRFPLVYLAVNIRALDFSDKCQLDCYPTTLQHSSNFLSLTSSFNGVADSLNAKLMLAIAMNWIFHSTVGGHQFACRPLTKSLSICKRSTLVVVIPTYAF